MSDKPQYCIDPHNEPFDKGVLAEQMLATCVPRSKLSRAGNLPIRSIISIAPSARESSGEIAKRWGNAGMSAAPLIVNLKGSAGQSFGVWNAGGLHLHLEGEANDYVGKGMAGGKIVLEAALRIRASSRATP